MTKFPTYPLIMLLTAALSVSKAVAQPAGEAPAGAEARQNAAGAAQQSKAGAGFDILEYVVEGNSTLSALEIERAVYPHLGPGKRIEDVEAAKTALEKAYHESGFLSVFVDIPEQKVAGGIVRLRVLESRIERLKVSGNRYFSQGDIKAAVPSLTPGEVPYFPEMQSELAQVSRAADRQITPLLRPGRNPGTMEVELAVEDRLPLHGSIELNNKQSPDTSNRRIEAALRYDNLWQAMHSLGLRYITAPLERDQVNVLVANYGMPVGKAGAQLVTYAIFSDSDVATQQDIGQLGKGTTLGLRYVLPLRAPRGQFHSVSLGFDYKDLDEATVTAGADTSKRPIRYLPLSLQYTGGAIDDGGTWQFGLSTTLGIRGLLRRTVDCDGFEVDQFECKRAGADGGFAVLRGEIERTQKLGAGFTLSVQLDGQIATKPLISNEQYSIGGYDSLAGYLESEQSGDSGLRLRTDLTTPNLASWLTEALDLRLLAFYHWGQVRLVDPLPAQAQRFTLASSGAGLRLTAFKGLKLRADFARTQHGASRTPEGKTRFHLGVAYEF